MTTDKKPRTDKMAGEDENLLEVLREIVELYNGSFSDTDLLTDTIDACREAINSFPEAPEPIFLLGLVAYRCGDEGQAIAMCETAHKMSPDTREYAEALSVITTSVGQLADGIYYAKLIDSMVPHPFLSEMMPARLRDLRAAFDSASPSGHLIEAMRLFNLADYARVIKECTSEIRLNARNFDAYILLARALLVVNGFNRAVGALQAAIQLNPKSALARGLLARGLIGLGNFTEAAATAEQAIRMSQGDAESYAQAMYALLRCPAVDINHAKDLAIEFQQKFDEENEPLSPEPRPETSNGSTHIGLLSNAFFINSTSDLFLSWFASSRHKKNKLSGYQQSYLNDSATTVAKKACDTWREIYDVDPFTLSLTMQAEELDAIVDLSGPDGDTRMTICGLHPCPVRVGAFALPEPGFAPGITHVLSDDILQEADQNALLPGQECVPVSGTLFARPPYSTLPKDIETPAKRNTYVTFGGVMDLSRLTPECAALWADVLHAVPKSRLLLVADEYSIQKMKARALEYFSHCGVIDRIMFPEPNAEDSDNGIESVESVIPAPIWREIDIFLDTTPVSCRAELCEALWTGAPALTLKSSRREGMIGASILTAATRMNWVSENRDNFINTAVSLASNFDHLEKERQQLQNNVGTSPLFDAPALADQVRLTLAATARASRHIEAGS